MVRRLLRRVASRGLWLTLLGAGLLTPSAVGAQRTGGSFGGGSFGGSSSGASSYTGSSGSPSPRSSHTGGSSFGGSSNGRHSSDGASSSSGEYSGPAYDTSAWLTPKVAAMLSVFGLSVLLGFFYLRKQEGSRSRLDEIARESQHAPRGPIEAWTGMDVTAISLAIDSSSRAFVQQRLMDLAKAGDTSSPGGLGELCRATSKLLRDVSCAWLYAGARNHPPMGAEGAEQAFRALATDYRARYRHEVVRAENSVVLEGDAPVQRARAEEGRGVAVVSVIVAARTELFDLTDARNVDEIQIALSTLGMLGDQQIVALEVIWSPAEEDDRMSTAELEMLYPELRKLERAGLVGRVICASCGGPYAAELGECPHCGAPAPARNG